MQVAQVISDLTSLRVCNSDAALALVNARPEESVTESVPKKKLASPEDNRSDTDHDLARARDLIQLHYVVKVAAVNGEIQSELSDIRRSVRNAAESII